MAIFISENDIEQTCLLVFLHTLHYDEHLNIWQQPDEGNAAFGRVDDTEVVRVAQLRRSLPQLNPGLLDAILATAEAELTRPRDHLTLYEANRAVTMLLQEGCNVPTRNSQGEILTERVRYVDFRQPLGVEEAAHPWSNERPTDRLAPARCANQFFVKEIKTV